MAFSSVLQMYLGWANSLLCEHGILIDGLHQLRDGTIFCHLIELLTGTQLLPPEQADLSDSDDGFALDTVQGVLDFLSGLGVKVSVSAKGVVHGELKSILDVMWSIILHCTIHSTERASYQRTVRIGRKLLLQWCSEELSTSIDTNKSMASVFAGNNLLSDLLANHCYFENNKNNRERYVVNLTNGILATEDHFGITKTLLGPADVINGTSDEHSLMIYIALLRRKASMLTSRHGTLSSDEDESIKISPKKQSPNTSKLSLGNLAHSERSSTTFSHLLTPQPPHNRYAPDLSSLSYKPPSVASSQSRTTTQDITPEKSDSGISTSADAPSLASSSLPSVTSSRTLGEQRLDWRENGDAVSAGNARHSREDKYSTKDTPYGAPSSVRTEPRFPERRADDARDIVSRRTDLSLHNVEMMKNSSFSGLPNGSSRPQDIKIQGRTSSSGMKDTSEMGRDEQDADERTRQGEAVDKINTSRVQGNGVVLTPDDELLHLLETIGEESQHLRLELSETKQREAILKTQLEEETVGSQEEKVISKLVQELEMLRTENRRLFRESATSKNANAQDRKAMEKLNTTITKLQTEVEHLNAENFNLRMKSKVGSDVGSVEIRRGSDAKSLPAATEEEERSSRFQDSDSYDLKRQVARAESKGEFLQARLMEMEEEMTRKLNQASEDLKLTRHENLRLEKECKLLRMSNETSHLEVETVAGRCRRLEEYLAHAQKRNTRLAQQLDDEAFKALSQDRRDQSRVVMARLEEESTLLKEKLGLAEEERGLLKHELAHYRQNKTTLDEVLRAWDVQTSNKFQSFVDDFRLPVNEQREPEETRRSRNPEIKPEGTEVKTRELQEVMHSSCVTSSSTKENTQQVSIKQATAASSLPSKAELKLAVDDEVGSKELKAAIDDKYLQTSPSRRDSDTEVDSEMESQTTDDTFSDLPSGYSEKARIEAGGVAKTASSEAYRRPSLGDLIVAKSQPERNEKPPNQEIQDRSDSVMLSRVSNEDKLNDRDVVKKESGTNSILGASEANTTSVPPARSHLTGRTRFSAVNASIETLRGITQKAKLVPERKLPSEEGTIPKEVGKSDVQTRDAEGTRDGDQVALKTGEDDLKIDANGGTAITNGFSLNSSNLTTNGGSFDSQSLPEKDPSSSFMIRQRLSPARGRFSRWRRLQSSRFQPALDGSYLDENRASSESLHKMPADRIPDWRNRSHSLTSSLNLKPASSLPSLHQQDSVHSEMGSNSFESEEEYASLPDRRNIVLGTGGGDAKETTKREGANRKDVSKKSLGRDRGDGDTSTQEERLGSRAAPAGSVSKPQFSSPQRLGFLRSKLGIKLERELLSPRSMLRKTYLDDTNLASTTSCADGPKLQSTNVNRSDEQSTNQMHSSKPEAPPSGLSNGKDDENKSNEENTSKTPLETEGKTSVLQTSSPDVSELSPASYNRFYKHKMLGEKDQELANSIIDKYLNTF
ncbi:uncharacterized protein LOC117304070 [Asterias rubens]|uniref:uncharacterized protein LOC117304070 n=1 Tax=Asterias rubens TaxID=7604 RepID=UPI001455B740|nr:uncharacterized protein LOC117304070 [Asterias rubens]